MVESAEKSLDEVVVLLDVYSTLLTVVEDNYGFLNEAKADLETLKSLGSVFLIAHVSEETQQEFFRANPTADRTRSVQ